jgi:hypothetical protein
VVSREIIPAAQAQAENASDQQASDHDVDQAESSFAHLFSSLAKTLELKKLRRKI